MNISGDSKTKHHNSHEMRFMEQNEVTYKFVYLMKYRKSCNDEMNSSFYIANVMRNDFLPNLCKEHINLVISFQTYVNRI